MQDKYNRVKEQTKAVATNPVYSTNIMLAIAAILILLIYGSTIAFNTDAFRTPEWWIGRACECLAMGMLLVSLTNIYYEKQKQAPTFTASQKVLSDKVYCCNDNQEKGTYNGVMNEVNEFNRQECERVWMRKLRKAVGSLFGTELSKLNKDFSEFDKLTDEWWESYFTERNFDKKRAQKVMKVVHKIRDNAYRVPRLITIDAVLYDTSKDEETISPVYNEAKDLFKGVIYRATSLLAFAAVLSSVFLDQPPDVKGWIYAVITRGFMVATTIFMSYTLGQKIAAKRKNALFKRINLLESAFNYCDLPLEIRAKYYDVSRKVG